VVTLRSPTTGRVLAIEEKSERVVAAGASLLEVGDPTRLEIVADLLSADAVGVPAAAPVLVEEWGGEGALRARVRLVEPAGFTKISALGVEEQRVNVVIDFVDPPVGLGDAYRVEVQIVLWEGEDVVKVPASALFRVGDDWAVYRVAAGRARARPVRIGWRNPSEAQILEGLTEGDTVVAHPSDQLRDGTRVEPRGQHGV
jgi:HlyD family secretion protein